jgi:hypothetical protein
MTPSALAPRLLRAAAAAVTLALAVGGAQAAETRPLFKDFMAINGHFSFKPTLYVECCRLARNYHNLDWDVKAPGDPIHVPACVNGVDWKRDVYVKWQAAGIETSICMQFGGFGTDHPGYQKLWEKREDWCFQYGKALAAYFGPSGAEKLCTSLEIGNEPGQKFDQALYRTIFTAMAKGIRAGDAKVKIVTPSVVARQADDYSQDVRALYEDPATVALYDVLNIHTYAAAPRKPGKESPWTRSYPEDPGIDYLKVVDEMVAWRDQHAPGKAVWITEFGYDACTPEAMKKREGWFLKLDWRGHDDLQQAQYLVRSFFAFAERDVARAYIYFYDDPDSPMTHGCAGLTRNFTPKQSFYAVRQLQRTLGDYRFARSIEKRAGELCVDEYVHGSTPGRVIWAAWSPTGVRTDERDGYVPHQAQVVLKGLPAKPTRVLAMATADGEPAAVAWAPEAAGEISLTVGESPVYIVMDGAAAK